MGAALGFAAAMLVLGVALVILRALYLDRLPASVSPAAAAAVFDAIVKFLRSSLRTGSLNEYGPVGLLFTIMTVLVLAGGVVVIGAGVGRVLGGPE